MCSTATGYKARGVLKRHRCADQNQVEEYLVQVAGLSSLMMSFPPTGVQRVSALLHWVSICCCSSVHRDIFSPLNDVSEVLQIQGRVQLSALMSHQPVCRKLQFQPLPADVPVLFQVVELPLKHHLCKVKSLNKGDANSEVTVYYQVKKTQKTHHRTADSHFVQ